LRETALANQPSRFSTGPRTAAGKAKAAANGKTRQTGQRSIRERSADLADVTATVEAMRDLRRTLLASKPTDMHFHE
jgi:hypothetical protein